MLLLSGTCLNKQLQIGKHQQLPCVVSTVLSFRGDTFFQSFDLFPFIAIVMKFLSSAFSCLQTQQSSGVSLIRRFSTNLFTGIVYGSAFLAVDHSTDRSTGHTTCNFWAGSSGLYGELKFSRTFLLIFRFRSWIREEIFYAFLNFFYFEYFQSPLPTYHGLIWPSAELLTCRVWLLCAESHPGSSLVGFRTLGPRGMWILWRNHSDGQTASLDLLNYNPQINLLLSFSISLFFSVSPLLSLPVSFVLST